LQVGKKNLRQIGDPGDEQGAASLTAKKEKEGGNSGG